MATQLARQRAAQAWCKSTTERIEMIPELAEAFAEILDEIWSQAVAWKCDNWRVA